MVHFKGSFQNFRRATPSFLQGSPPRENSFEFQFEIWVKYTLNGLFTVQCFNMFLYVFFYFHFTTVGDLVVQYYDRNISTIDLLMRLNMTYAHFDVRRIKCPFVKYSCESVCPLDNEDQERLSDKTCYCDKLCVEFGDCCFDYFLRLVA